MSFLKDAISKKPPEAAPSASSLNLPARYQSMLDANPYRNQSYNESPWQAFLSNLGFRTQADAWKENMAVQAAEYDAAIAQKAADEAYETPAAQTARMRAAGLNPDLNGGEGISPGDAASLPQDPSTPMQSTGEEGVVSGFVNGVMSIFSSAIGIVETFQGIKGRNLQNHLLAIQGQEGMAQYAKDMFPYMLPTSPEPAGMQQSYDWKAETLRNARAFSRKLPRKMRDSFYSHIERFWDSAPADEAAFKVFLDRVKARKGYYEESSSNYSEFNVLMRDIWEPLGDLMQKNLKRNLELQEKRYDTEESQLTTEKAQAEETKQYLDVHNASAEGKAANAQYTAQEGAAELTEIIKSTINKITGNLQKTAEKGGVDGFFANVLLMLFSMNAEGMIPKF